MRLKGIAAMTLVGTMAVAGIFLPLEVNAGIKAMPEKATKLNQTIKVKITAPKGCKFKKASWTGPGGLKGPLNIGVNNIIASKYSKALKDYVFTVWWKNCSEANKPEKAYATLYRHWDVWCEARMGAYNYCYTKIYGRATPNGATASGTIAFVGSRVFTGSGAVANNAYSMSFSGIGLGAANPVPINAQSDIDGVLLKTGKSTIGGNIRIAIFPLR